MTVSGLLRSAVVALASARPGAGVRGRGVAAVRSASLRALLAAMLDRRHLGELLASFGEERPGTAARDGQARAVLDALRRWPTTCLYRALAGYAVLRSEGQDARGARDRIARLAEALRLPVVMAEGFPREERFHACLPYRSEILHVDPRGRLSLCCQLSGTPGGDADVVADLAEVDLVEAHRRLLRLVHEVEERRLVHIGSNPPGDWDLFPCNVCQESFGKPHWTDQGAAGPRARRERFGGVVPRTLPGN